MPSPSTCHNFMKSCVPEDWMKKLKEKDLEELAHIQSCSVLQALSVDTVMNARAREAERELEKFCGTIESLREKLFETKRNAHERLSELRGELREAKQAVVELDEQRGQLVTQVIPHVCRQLLGSWEFGKLVADFVRTSRKWERAMVLEELAASGEKVVLGEREDYDRDALRKCTAASDALARAQFPYVHQVSSSPDASVRELLAIMPHPREEGEGF